MAEIEGTFLIHINKIQGANPDDITKDNSQYTADAKNYFSCSSIG